MNKENCTKGPVYAFKHEIRKDNELGDTIAKAVPHPAFGDDEREANAELIAEAFSVLHETGYTPAELAEQKVELLRILNMAVNCLRVCHTELHEAGCNEAADDTHNDILVYMDTLSKYQPVTPA